MCTTARDVTIFCAKNSKVRTILVPQVGAAFPACGVLVDWTNKLVAYGVTVRKMAPLRARIKEANRAGQAASDELVDLRRVFDDATATAASMEDAFVVADGRRKTAQDEVRLLQYLLIIV
jgi:hypothetical protein